MKLYFRNGNYIETIDTPQNIRSNRIKTQLKYLYKIIFCGKETNK